MWAHDPTQQRDDWLPYEWSDEPDGGRIVTLRAREAIRLDRQGNAVVTLDVDDQ